MRALGFAVTARRSIIGLVATCSLFCALLSPAQESGYSKSQGLPVDPPATVAVGSSSVLPFDPVIEGVDIVDRTVSNARLIRRGVVIQGLKIGKTRVTIWGEGFGIKTFDVIVFPDRTEVLVRLLQKYPQSGLRLIPSPETGKVIFEGMMPTASAIEDALAQIEGPDLARSQILNRLCYPCPLCPPQGNGCYRPIRFRHR